MAAPRKETSQLCMDDGWHQVQSRRRPAFPAYLQPRPHNLGSLLTEEWFLLMVFEHLIDYGLHDCRLVCRKWYKVCLQFPVTLERISHAQLENAVDAFPNAVAVSMSRRGRAISDIKFFELLASLPRLKSLECCGSALTLTGDAHPFFKPMSQLRQLNIFFHCSKETEGLISSVRYLTALTKLTVVGRPWQQHPMDPFSELRNIRELEVEFDLFTDARGECFFPSLTNLTRLVLTTEWNDDESHVHSTQGVSLYVSSLRHLCLDSCTEPTSIDWFALPTLTNLRTLELSRACVVSEGFWETLENMLFLTKLRSEFWGFMDGNMRDSIATLTNLEALDFCNVAMHGIEDEELTLAPRVRQLTELSVILKGTLISQLSCLTRLVHLELRVYSGGSCCLDDALSCMPNLESLDVEREDDDTEEQDGARLGSLRLCSCALSNVGRLKSLSLDSVDVDKRFFRQLASMAELTKLEFSLPVEKTLPCSFISQVNLLGNVEELKLDLSGGWSVCDLLLPQCLVELKKLNVHCSQEQLALLRRRFARRPGVRINRKQSSWAAV